MQFVYKKEWYSKAFGEVLLSRHRRLILKGGRGSGKTRHIILKLVARTFYKGHVAIYYCRNYFETIRKNTFNDIVNFFKSCPELAEYFEFSDKPNSSMIFTNKLTGNKMYPFGLDDPDNTKGISEATEVWVDEMDKCTLPQVMAIDAVLRTPQAEYLQFIGSFNPVSIKSWVKSFYFDEDGINPHPKFNKDEILIHHSTVYDNEFIDVEAYVRNLMLMYGYSQNLINVNVHGMWGIEENDNPWFTAFNHERHVSKTIIEPYRNLPIYVSMDFNTDPMCAIVGQHSQIFNQSSWCHILKEYKINLPKKAATEDEKISIIDEVCDKVKADYPGHIIFASGDASGRNRNAAYGKNDNAWNKVMRRLKLAPNQLKTPLSNLSHKESRFINNYILYNFPKFLINPTCENLIHEINIAKPIVTNNPEKEDDLMKGVASGEYGMNLVDCFRYYNDSFLKPFVRKY